MIENHNIFINVRPFPNIPFPKLPRAKLGWACLQREYSACGITSSYKILS